MSEPILSHKDLIHLHSCDIDAEAVTVAVAPGSTLCIDVESKELFLLVSAILSLCRY